MGTIRAILSFNQLSRIPDTHNPTNTFVLLLDVDSHGFEHLEVVEGHLSPFRSLTAHMRGSPVCGVVPGGVCPGVSRPSRECVCSAAMGAVVATKGRESTASKELPP